MHWLAHGFTALTQWNLLRVDNLGGISLPPAVNLGLAKKYIASVLMFGLDEVLYNIIFSVCIESQQIYERFHVNVQNAYFFRYADGKYKKSPLLGIEN